MVSFLIFFLISFIFLFNGIPAFSKDISHKNLDALTEKVSKKFSRTYCNTSNFGISNEGAIEFAIGETNKEFSKNKYINEISSEEVFNKIISYIEKDCQVYDFPIIDLERLDFKKK